MNLKDKPKGFEYVGKDGVRRRIIDPYNGAIIRVMELPEPSLVNVVFHIESEENE